MMLGTVDAQLNFDDMTGGCEPSAQMQCGGHGACDPVARTCACDEWWSQRSDFVDSQDCPTSLIAIYVLWGLNIAEIIWVLYSTSYVLVARAENYFEQRRLKKDYSLWKNKGLIAVMIYFGVSLPSQLAMAILHMVDPVTRVGFELFPTVLFFFGKVGLYLSSIFLQGPLISAVLHGQPGAKRLVKLNYMLNFGVSTCSIIVGTFAFITFDYFRFNLPKQIEIMRAYYFVQAATLIINGLQAYMVKKWVYKVLDTAKALVSSGDKTESLKRKVGDLQGQIIKQGILQGIIYVIMGAVPFLINKHAYFLPLSWLAMPIIGKRLAFQFDLDKAGAKTIAARLGLKKSSAFDNSTTGSKKRKEGDISFNADITQSENPSFMQGSQFGSTVQPVDDKQGKTGKKNAKQAQLVLSVAISDEEGGMQEIMSEENTALKEKFTEFVRGRYATEALVLYDECAKYQAMARSGASQDQLREMGKKIVDAHVREDAPQPVDMPDDMRKELIAAQSHQTFTAQTFDKAKGMAFDLLKSNFYHHFAKSYLT